MSYIPALTTNFLFLVHIPSKNFAKNLKSNLVVLLVLVSIGHVVNYSPFFCCRHVHDHHTMRKEIFLNKDDMFKLMLSDVCEDIDAFLNKNIKILYPVSVPPTTTAAPGKIPSCFRLTSKR